MGNFNPEEALPFNTWDSHTFQDGSDEVDEMLGVAAGLDNTMILGGYTFGNWTVTNQGGEDFSAAKLDSDGEQMWQYQVKMFASVVLYPMVTPRAATVATRDLASISGMKVPGRTLASTFEGSSELSIVSCVSPATPPIVVWREVSGEPCQGTLLVKCSFFSREASFKITGV